MYKRCDEKVTNFKVKTYTQLKKLFNNSKMSSRLESSLDQSVVI